ncbi:PREDICTED: uncharacterized protein LOC108970681 [Bactrocera latifrons]|uniref:uncharacterized protein LOC108970681 n=1 Tax=Bactrocera latifrons TaxID=174628 RepID=UPI0008DDF75B|nr:PREDICTED: uncharacterized protein LOC108970681 [Bactrocera latifrons]
MPAGVDTPCLPKPSMFLGNNSSPAIIRVPLFNQDKPALWFTQLESQFRNHSVTSEVDKLHHTIPLIDTRIAADAEDIILNPPVDKPYQRLKTKLIACYSKLREAEIVQLPEGHYIAAKSLTTTHNSNSTAVEQQLAHITKCLQKRLDTHETTGRKCFRAQCINRSRSVSPAMSTSKTCWYQKKFGELAQKCTSNCQQAGNGAERR